MLLMDSSSEMQLNESAAGLLRDPAGLYRGLRISQRAIAGGGTLIDFGVEVEGGIGAGLLLAHACLARLGAVTLSSEHIEGFTFPSVEVTTDAPVAACLLSQYAGWQINPDGYFGMGSGPIRAAAAREEMFEALGYRETPSQAVGIIESGQLPDAEVFQYLAGKSGIAAERIILAVAPTSSQAGNVQIVARSVETAMHKLYKLGFDVRRVVSGFGTAPLPPVAMDDLTGIGRTNDAILYGGRVTLWVRGDDQSIAELGPQVPSSASETHGRPFLEIFQTAGRDFYAIDPLLFSPAQIVFQNLDTGRVQCFGAVDPAVLLESFGPGTGDAASRKR